MRWMPILILGLALAGCAGSSMDEAQCLTADWRAIGYEDGAQGHGADAFGRHRKACAEYGVAAEFDPYLRGHGEGLAVFCRPRNGYNLGLGGRRYSGVCPVHLEAAFVEAHGDGFGLYERRKALKRLGKRLSHSKARAEEIEHLLVKKTALLVSPDLVPADRAAIAVELKHLTEEKIEVEHALHDLEDEYDEAEREYRDYRGAMARRYRG